MKTTINRLLFVLGIGSSLFISCKENLFEEKQLSKVNIGFNYQDGILVAESESVSKNAGFVTIPVEISLSDAAPTLFNISLSANSDTVNKLIDNNVLTNTLIMPSGQYTTPTNTEVRFGAKSVTIYVSVSLSYLELNFGKKVAMGLDITGASRGNKVDEFKKTVIVVVNSTDIIDENDVHSIKFAEGGERYNINATSGLSFTQSLTQFTIPLEVELVGSPGSAVAVKVESNRDSVLKMQLAGVLPPNTVVLEDNTLVLPSGNINIAANQSNAFFNLNLDPKSLSPHFGKSVAFALRLKEPSLYSLDPIDKTIVVIINTMVLQNITWYMKNMARPYSVVIQADPRWATPTDWIVNDAAKNHLFEGVYYGGYDKNNTSITLGGSSTTQPIITNAKVYQTITLPAGSYTYYLDIKDVANAGSLNTVTRRFPNGDFFAVVALGDGIPNTADVVTSSLAYGYPEGNDKRLNLNFTLNQPTKVSLGVVATSKVGNYYVTVRENRLLHTYP